MVKREERARSIGAERERCASLTERGGVCNGEGANRLQAAQSGRGGSYIMKADRGASDKRISR